MQAETLNYLLALGTVAAQIGAAGLFALYFFGKGSGPFSKISLFLQSKGTLIGLLVTLAAAALTLYYSEVIGYPPCPLCWWQRIFLYPQVVLFALAIWFKDQKAIDYSIAFSIIGLGVALYNHALQILPSGSLPCPAEGTVSCAQRFIFEFGYITFPLMAATLFAFLIVAMLFARARR